MKYELNNYDKSVEGMGCLLISFKFPLCVLAVGCSKIAERIAEIFSKYERSVSVHSTFNEIVFVLYPLCLV